MTVINEIKARVDITEIISEHVSLQKAGRNFRALCPFHKEKHPSFFVFPDRQSWHCFGACNTGGDVFSFLMKKENADFGQVLRLLAKRTGVSLISEEKKVKTKEENIRLFEINEVAAEYYHNLLLKSTSAEGARNYLTGRGLSAKTIENFQLGFSLSSWDDLLQYLTGRGYQFEELVTAGLVIEKEKGNGYDRFRNRLVFPIRNIHGHVTGFGARALDESMPKYLNSPETPIFDKGGILYGIDRAKVAFRQRNLAVIVEGYMDVLMAHQYDWENVVASMGTAITEKQFNILKKLTKNITLALDADTAGEEATLRSIETAIETSEKKVLMLSPVRKWAGEGKAIRVDYSKTPDIDIKVLILPPGKDPDEVIKEDISLWRNLVEKAVPVLDFAVDSVVKRADLKQAHDKSMAVDKLLPIISGIGNYVKQAHYLKVLAKKLDVNEESILKSLKEYEIHGHRKLVTEAGKHFYSAPFITPLSRPERFRPEEYCLSLLFLYPELRAEAKELKAEYFRYTENRELFTQWQQNPDLASLRLSLVPALNEYLDQLLSEGSRFPISQKEKERRHNLSECIRRLKERWLKALAIEREELLSLEAERGGVEGQLSELKEQGLEVSTGLKEVFSKQRRQRI